ncbi:uncharacterized protein LOC123321744 [Coccinella septempunctata]|uniref:uncharacterized protein LOC123321744 n=1 Tax=Coccinella septempunctata TaxID=41139 RepID=UPI001D06F15C|nr:uncharacterized protein LOC123321744 [Coccinella septempunctata]
MVFNMKLVLTILFFFTINSVCFCDDIQGEANISQNPAHEDTFRKKNISDEILLILDHYKQNDPVGLPGAPIPDPFSVPPFSHRFQIGRMHFENVKIYGLKKFRIKFMKANMAKMTVDVSLDIGALEIHGNYTLSSFFTSAEGPFTVNAKNVTVDAVASMKVERDGKLEAQEINMDVSFEDVSVNFENLGFFASMFQGIINTVGDSLFKSIKPFILSEVNDNIRADVNQEIRKLPVTFPNSISPFDQVFVMFRQEVRRKNYDPLSVPNLINVLGIFDLYMRNIKIFGLSTVHRSGEAVVEFKNGSIYGFFEGGTQKLRGVCNWELSLIAGIIGKTGKIDFTIDYFMVKVNASQSLNTDFPPTLEDIQLELGNIQLRFDGTGSLDYLLELGINVMPNIIRYQVMNALEGPVKNRIQEALDQVNIKYLIVENADKINNPDSRNFL